MRFTICLAAATMALAAHAGPITPSQAEDVIEAAGGTLSESRAAGDDSHVIDAKFEDANLNFSIRLGDCDDTGACKYAMMFATFDLGEAATTDTLVKSNAYNDSYPFGRAFVIPGEEEAGDVVGIDYVLDLSSEATLDTGDMALFKDILNSYFTHWTAEE